VRSEKIWKTSHFVVVVVDTSTALKNVCCRLGLGDVKILHFLEKFWKEALHCTTTYY
jgi:hypothetical protein